MTGAGAAGGATECDVEVAGGAACAAATAAVVDVTGAATDGTAAAFEVVGAALVGATLLEPLARSAGSDDRVGLDDADVEDEGEGVTESATARGLIPFEAAMTATAHSSTVATAAELITDRRARM